MACLQLHVLAGVAVGTIAGCGGGAPKAERRKKGFFTCTGSESELEKIDDLTRGTAHGDQQWHGSPMA